VTRHGARLRTSRVRLLNKVDSGGPPRAASREVASPSDGHQVRFLAARIFVDLGDVAVGELLHVLLCTTLFVWYSVIRAAFQVSLASRRTLHRDARSRLRAAPR
jgi:hypothetical protein